MENARGQAAAEYLVILAAVFVLVLIGIIISQQQIVDIGKTRTESVSRTSLNVLSTAAREVYAQGEDARKRVFIEIPSGYSPSASYVANKTIFLSVAGADYVTTNDFDVTGSLPNTPGNHWVWVISEGNNVRIGTAMLELSKSSIYIIMERNSTKSDSFSVKNIFGNQVNITVSEDIESQDIGIYIVPIAASINPLASQSESISVQAGPNAVGIYSGKITVYGQSGNDSEYVILPITIEIVLPPASGASPPLTITPSIWNATMLPNTTAQKAFQVCTNSFTYLNSVSFSTTAGPAGSWVGGKDNLPAMGPDSCQTKVFNMSIPAGTAPGAFLGTITATGEGAQGAEDTVSLQITVGGNITDNQGPVVSNITRIPKRSFVGDPVTITALCDDRQKGNSSIKNSEISVDSGPWTTMNPSDGTYNSPAENVSYTVYSLAFGRHNATLRCIDAFNNVGTQSSIYNFNVMKEILFITKDEGSSGPEQEWQDWLSTHSSNESLAWTKDQIQRTVVIDADFDMNRYATAVIAENVLQGETGSQLATKLMSFSSEGGRVIIVDKAVQSAAQLLGLGYGFEYFAQNTIYIRSADHYITQAVGTGTKIILTTNSKVYYIFPYSGTTLAMAQVWFGTDYATLGSGGGYVVWGVSKPYRFNSNGNVLTTRVFDYAITNSTIGSG